MKGVEAAAMWYVDVYRDTRKVKESYSAKLNLKRSIEEANVSSNFLETGFQFACMRMRMRMSGPGERERVRRKEGRSEGAGSSRIKSSNGGGKWAAN